MKDILDSIIYIAFIISIPFVMFMGFKYRAKENKKLQEELIKEGKSVNSNKNPKHVAKVLGGMLGSSIIIAIIITYTCKVKFSMSPFLGMIFIVFMFETCIGSIVGVGKYIIKRTIEIKKKEGTMAAIIILVMFIIFEAAYLYIKDFKRF